MKVHATFDGEQGSGDGQGMGGIDMGKGAERL